jgi:dipeptidyl aminopeptidase/acylaminoacyl peptidase
MKNLLLCFALLNVFLAFGQSNIINPTPKLPLTHAAYNEWRSIDFKSLSNDGNYLAHTLNYDVADGKLVLLNLKSGAELEADRAEKINFSFDSKHLVFHIVPQTDTLKALRRQKTKKDDLPNDSLGIYNLSTKLLTKIASIKSYKMPAKSGGWVAYQLAEAPKQEKSDTTAQKGAKSKPAKKANEENGYPLLVRNLTTGGETSLGFAKEYVFAENGSGLLVYSLGNDSTIKAGVYWVDLATVKPNQIFQSHEKYKVKNLAIDESGTQATFIADTDTTKALTRLPKLYYWKSGMPNATIAASEGDRGILDNWLVSEHFKPYFSKDGSKLYFGTNPKPIVADTALLPEEIVNVEVWHWQQDYIYPEQNVRANNDRKASYTVVKHLTDGRIAQLGDESLSEIALAEEGNANVALGKDDRSYRMMRTWDITAYDDLYQVDTKTGERKLVAEKIKGRSGISPKGKYIYWYSMPDTAWFTYSIANEATVKLTLPNKLSFADEIDDHPDYPSEYGMAGWTKDDERLWLYDRYDVWAFDPEGKSKSVNVTKVGRSTLTTYRYEKTDPEAKFIDTRKKIALSNFNENTKKAGFSQLSAKKLQLENSLVTDHRYGSLSKARNSDTYLFTRESYTEFPDLQTAASDFTNVEKVTDANPQQQKYAWGSVETVSWTSLEDIPLEGLLYKPENFDPKKKYPMIVYYYERNSDNLHTHWEPEPLRSIIHFTMYASNGYLVFVPDIVYKDGYPGESAFNAILPGVTSLINKGFVQDNNIGIQGHSWGGYQTAYMVTRTDMFKAAEAGAIVANMTSAYGGIRWGSGLARTFQYEKSQSRIGATLWENPQLYIENSPLFFADKIKTPLLLMHNDEDTAVPWYQGIEMYLAMRRLDKPCWMLNYNGEPHWPVKRENRVDFQIRMSQFFDHYLKGAPMPVWMKNGVPAIEKGINQGYELIDN